MHNQTFVEEWLQGIDIGLGTYPNGERSVIENENSGELTRETIKNYLSTL